MVGGTAMGGGGTAWGHHEGAVWVPMFGVIFSHYRLTAGSQIWGHLRSLQRDIGVQILGSFGVIMKGHWVPHVWGPLGSS